MTLNSLQESIKLEESKKYLNCENIKIKQISEADYLIYLNKLTRFGNPLENLRKVYEDIALKYMIVPKISKKSFQALPFEFVEKLVKTIWDGGLKEKNNLLNDYLNYENRKVFRVDLKCNLNIYGAIEKIKDVRIPNGLQDNIIRLFSLKNIVDKNNSLENIYEEIITERKKKGFLYPVRMLILAEGITEEILLPKFSKIYGLDMSKEGIKIISAGGKNQVARLYKEFSEILTIPIFLILDSDAIEVAETIEKIKRNKDFIYLIKEGEFEDILPDKLIIRAVNRRYKNVALINKNDFSSEEKMVKNLENIWKMKGFGSFEKSAFSRAVEEVITTTQDLSIELKEIIEILKRISN